jgi:hypothetical protein
MNATKIDHAARRWALRGVKYQGSGPSEIWWAATGFIGDEDMCGLYTHAKAKELIDWLCSDKGISSRLEGFAYDIVRLH